MLTTDSGIHLYLPVAGRINQSRFGANDPVAGRPDSKFSGRMQNSPAGLQFTRQGPEPCGAVEAFNPRADI
jgi:hypothetical protein